MAHAHTAPLSRHGGHHLSQSGAIALKNSKRDGSARFTYYDAGENACGSYDANTDYVSNINRPNKRVKRLGLRFASRVSRLGQVIALSPSVRGSVCVHVKGAPSGKADEGA